MAIAYEVSIMSTNAERYTGKYEGDVDWVDNDTVMIYADKESDHNTGIVIEVELGASVIDELDLLEGDEVTFKLSFESGKHSATLDSEIPVFVDDFNKVL